VGIGLNKIGILIIIITVRIRHYKLNIIVFIAPIATAIENTSSNTLTSAINTILSRLIKTVKTIKAVKTVKTVKTVTITNTTRILRIIVVTRTLTRSSRTGNRALISVEGLGLSPIQIRLSGKYDSVVVLR